jgi:hypothetical protein
MKAKRRNKKMKCNTCCDQCDYYYNCYTFGEITKKELSEKRAYGSLRTKSRDDLSHYYFNEELSNIEDILPLVEGSLKFISTLDMEKIAENIDASITLKRIKVGDVLKASRFYDRAVNVTQEIEDILKISLKMMGKLEKVKEKALAIIKKVEKFEEMERANEER